MIKYKLLPALCSFLILYICIYFFREGSTEAFSKLFNKKIPIIVLSAGIGDVVELILKHENLFTDNVSVVSNFLKMSEDSNGFTIIEGFKGKKLIHVFNKNEHAYIDTHKNVKEITNNNTFKILSINIFFLFSGYTFKWQIQCYPFR